MMPKSGHRTSWEEALPPLSPECQPWPQHHCHPLSEWSLCGSPVPGSLCHHLSTPFRLIPGYTPHSRCPGGGGRERRYFAFSPSLWRGGPWCIMWRVSVGLGPILPSILAHPPPYAPRGADVLSPTLWTPENWTLPEAKTEVHICLTSSEERHFP